MDLDSTNFCHCETCASKARQSKTSKVILFRLQINKARIYLIKNILLERKINL